MTSKNKLLKKTSSWIVVAALSCLMGLDVQAASTDISAEPLTTVSDVSAKPNIMFILDDSGSMDSSYMPDTLNGDTDKYGYWSSQCNGVGYNPAFNYALPVKADGTTYPNSNFSAAWTDGFAATGSVNLGGTVTTTTSNRTSSTSQAVGTGIKTFVINETNVTATSYTVGNQITFESSGRIMTGLITIWNSGNRNITVNVTSTSSSGTRSSWNVTSTTDSIGPSPYYYVYTGTQPAMGWTYNTAGVIQTTFYNQCMSDIGSAPGSGVFTKVEATSLTTAQKQNYANWYSYYRKRFLLMRTAVGRAFQPLDSGYRVGFSVINDTSVTSTSFLDAKDFDTTHKASFYSKLYTEAPGGNTPLRAALSKVGQYYAKKAANQTYDPMQYSCQRNYALLSTDGYWNDAAGTKLDRTTALGNQDGTADRPMRDSTKAVVTTVTPTTTTVRRQIDSTYSTPTTWTRYRWTVGNSRTDAIPVMTQTRSQASALTTSVVRDESTTVTRTVVTTDGVVTSDTSVTGSTVTTPVSTGTTGTFNAWTNTTSANKSALSQTQFNNSGLTLNSTFYSGGCNASSTSANVGGGGCGFSLDPATMGVASRTPTVTTSVVSTTAVVGTVSTTNSTAGGASNTLADVAQYYYTTDLRTTALGNCTSTTSGTSQDTCADTLKPSGRDSANYQHMTTYSIGLGVNGTLIYDKNYLTQTTGDYVRLKNGTINWPDPGSDDGAVNIDDLWHAAVNGRGQYYSALDAGALSQAISGVLTSVTEEVASSSAAATSALELVPGAANEVFKASYTTVSWTGDLQSFSLNGTTGAIGTTANWSAQAKLDAKNLSTRKIYYRQAPATSTLREFTYTNLSADGYGANFENLCSKTLVSGQCATLSSTNLTLANSGTNLVDYLRGVRTYEGGNSASPLYRTRSHLLGDIINGAPVYTGGSPFTYSDAGYAAFSAGKTTRKRMVYVGGNDGMVHAISAEGTDAGEELWAYVPTAVMPNMYKLADTSYASRHQYMVDGLMVVGDISVDGVWKTILVGGLNSGGKSYYALDITDPANPLTLWEFTNTNLGLTYGNPIITKRADGTWVVAFTSGYNNADGQGHLFVVNANTGALLKDISTGVGSNGSPSGLAKMNAWIEQASNNTATRFYGGDLLGNLWRFDVDGLYLPNSAAMLLATFQIDANTPQPITTRPELSLISGAPVVLVGTGRYLGSSDITDSVQQSIYAIKDPLTATGWGNVRSTGTLVNQSGSITTTGVNAGTVGGSNNAVDWSSKSGWRVDFNHTRERVAINMAQQFNTLTVATAIPNGDACSSGGSSWKYHLNVATGSALMNGNVLGTVLSETSLAAGLSWVKLDNGTTRIIVQDSSGALRVIEPPDSSSSVKGPLHRTSWRELVD